jgi:hypothetical protein
MLLRFDLYPRPMANDHRYWSANGVDATDDTVTNFTIKWIIGEPFDQGAETLSTELDDSQTYFVWRSIPKMTALNCMPLYETVDAEVTVDIGSLVVQDYSLTTHPQNATSAWSDPWVIHANGSLGNFLNVLENVTVS